MRNRTIAKKLVFGAGSIRICMYTVSGMHYSDNAVLYLLDIYQAYLNFKKSKNMTEQKSYLYKARFIRSTEVSDIVLLLTLEY